VGEGEAVRRRAAPVPGEGEAGKGREASVTQLQARTHVASGSTNSD
jgi:hypothetical protein